MSLKQKKSHQYSKGLAWGWLLCFVAASGFGLFLNNKFLQARTQSTSQNSLSAPPNVMVLIHHGDLLEAGKKVSSRTDSETLCQIAAVGTCTQGQSPALKNCAKIEN